MENKSNMFLTKEYLQGCVGRIKELCECVILECDKWIETNPEMIFEAGYAEEKITKMMDRLKDTQHDINLYNKLVQRKG